MNVVFIGHVDAGKSTTAGQILFLTGGVDDRTIEKYEREAKEKNRESWYMAYIMDTNEEERAKVRWSSACDVCSSPKQKFSIVVDRVRQLKLGELILKQKERGIPYWMHQVTSLSCQI